MRPLSFPLRVDDAIINDAPLAEVRDPYRGDVVGTVGLADAARAEQATRATARAFETTRRLSSFDKKSLLRAHRRRRREARRRAGRTDRAGGGQTDRARPR